MLFSSFIAGFLGTLSPCVYPLIPITLSLLGLKKPHSHWHGFRIAATYVAGMMLLYTILGVLFAYAGFLAGSALQSPWLNGFLAVLMLFMALNLFNLLSWSLPHSLTRILNKVNHSHSHFHAFSMGLIAGIVATPCTGPILAGILTLITQGHDINQGIWLMLAYSLGMGLPFLILGTFSSWIHKIPKSGPWMNRIKFILGLFMLLVSFHYAQLSVQGFKRQQFISTYQAIEQKIKHARAQNKKIILEFGADWCSLCQRLETETLKNKAVQKALENYELIKVDLTVDSAETQALQEAYQVVGLPTLVFIDSNEHINGFIDPQKLIQILQNKLLNFY